MPRKSTTVVETETTTEEIHIPSQGEVTTLIGYVEKRGVIDSPKTIGFKGAVPIKKVLDLVFNWQVTEAELVAKVKTGGRGRPMEYRDPSRKVLVREGTGTIFGVFTSRYKAVSHDEWFVQFVTPMLGENLGIGSAGTLNDGAVAWATVEQTNSSRVEDVAFRSTLFAVHSLDGTLPTQYHLLVNNTVCDNFMSPNPAEGKTAYGRKRSTKNMEANPLSNAQAGALIKQATADFKATVETLYARRVTKAQWDKFLNLYCPIGETEGRGQTLAINKQDVLNDLWNNDERVAPWKNTAYGVLAAVNTYEHHEGYTRGSIRTERNMLRAASGRVHDLDSSTLGMLNAVLGK